MMDTELDRVRPRPPATPAAVPKVQANAVGFDRIKLRDNSDTGLHTGAI